MSEELNRPTGENHDSDSPNSEEKLDAFAAFMVVLEKELETLGTPSLLTEETELHPLVSDYPDKEKMYRLDSTHFSDALRAAVQEIHLFVHNIQRNKSEMKVINGITIPRIIYSADIRVLVSINERAKYIRRVTMEVGDIFPLALFDMLPQEVRQVPVFKVKSIERKTVILMPVYNHSTTLPEN